MRYTVFGLVLGIQVSLISGLMAAGTFADSQISERTEITKTRDLFPVAVFPETEYSFEAVADGIEIRYDFIVQNTGTAELDIKKVKTGWGCTAVSYTRQIPPGGEGKISIKVDTNGYGGKMLNKTIRVMTTDPKKPVTKLTIKGSVKNFATITPNNIRLYGKVGEPVKETVRIVPEDSYPFKILETKARIGHDIRYQLTSEKQTPGGVYLLTVENLKQETGRYYDTIFLVTDSRVKPKISIQVYGKISGSETRKAN